jgi:hypothetical protein
LPLAAAALKIDRSRASAEGFRCGKHLRLIDLPPSLSEYSCGHKDVAQAFLSPPKPRTSISFSAAIFRNSTRGGKICLQSGKFFGLLSHFKISATSSLTINEGIGVSRRAAEIPCLPEQDRMGGPT